MKMRLSLLLLATLLLTPAAFAQIEATNGTNVFDAAGKNMGPLVLGNFLRFRLNDGRSVLAQLQVNPSTGLSWITDTIHFSGSGCSGSAYGNAWAYTGGTPSVVAGNHNLYTGVNTSNVNFTEMSYIDANTGNCVNATQAASGVLLSFVVDIDTIFTEPYEVGGPPTVVVPSFSDVSAASPYFEFVEMMKTGGITSGCGGGKYCPDSYVTRAQMAVFIAKAMGIRFQP
jgi:hypothetical protein